MKILNYIGIKKVKKSVRLLIGVWLIVLVALISFDNIVYFSNREEVEKNREKLSIDQIRNLNMISTKSNLTISEQKYIDAGYILDDQDTIKSNSNDTINKKGE
ncbi:MAG: hypothetical protein H6Q15_948 [Bacteroidetes bacterium]|nr:hypothetical protein [Bacteroidota bacterium]